MIWIRQNLALFVLLLLLVVIGLLFGTGRLQLRWSAQHAEREESDQAGESQQRRSAGDTITVDSSTFEVSKIEIAPVGTASLPVIFQTPGEVQLSPDRTAHVTPQLAGVIRSIVKNVGDTATKGETLCVIESAELGDARASYLAALSERDFAERNYQRWNLLFEKGLRTQNELYAAETDLTRAKIKLESTEARLRALGFVDQDIGDLQKNRSQAVSNRYALRSPISGSVLERNLTVGQNVDTKDQLFIVGDISVVWVQAVAHERDLAQLRTGLRAVVHIQSIPNSSFPGTVTYLGQQVDEKTRTTPMRIVVRNRAHRSNPSLVLRPGIFTTVEVTLATRREVPAIPDSAVQTESDRPYVFVELQSPTSGNNKSARTHTFQRRPVSLGAHANGRVEVVNGLTLGERVVVENAFLLTAEMEKSDVEE
jgi:cobalt-zinc-cadmium efflux system membrane fusion protein